MFVAATFRCVALSVALASGAATCAAADDFVFAATQSRQFGTLDLQTGAFSQTGTTAVTFAGMAVWGSNLYAGSYRTGSGDVLQVNQSTGSSTFVGTTQGISFVEFGSTTSGLYAISEASQLYSINPVTGSSTLIGSTGVPIPFNTGSAVSLSNAGNVLYMDSATSLYRLNTSTGAASFIGNTGGPEFDSLTIVNGTLYGAIAVPFQALGIVDPSTAHVSSIANFTGTNSYVYGLAGMPSVVAVPEPSTWFYLLAGLLTLPTVAIRARRAK